MRAQVIAVSGSLAGEIELPEVFGTPYRPDLIKKAVLAAQANRRQPYGPNPASGTKTSAESWGVDRGVSRVPRIKSGSRAARVPSAVGGRSAHPPKVEKVWSEKINRKERMQAVMSAIGATCNEELVKNRGHIFDAKLPVVVEDRVEELKKTKEVEEFLRASGLFMDIERASVRKVRAGKGKGRGRKYKKRKSILFVIAKDGGLRKAAVNLPGVDVADVRTLNAELLAPGTHAGRLTVFSRSAIKEIGEKCRM